MKNTKVDFLLLLLVFLFVVALLFGYWFLFLKKESFKDIFSGKVVPTAEVNNFLKVAPKTVNNDSPFFLEVISPKNGIIVNTNKIEVSGKTNPSTEIFVNEVQVIPDATGNFSINLTLEEGENYILIVSGNEKGDGEVERTVTYEFP